MNMQTLYDTIKIPCVTRRVPRYLVMGCVMAESSGDPDAWRVEHIKGQAVRSEGLLQVLTTTREDMDKGGFNIPPEFRGRPLSDPEVGLEYGIAYLAYCHARFPEIPSEGERWKFAVAAYNAGFGQVNEALTEARRQTNIGRSEDGEWARGVWQEWWYASSFLVDKAKAITIPHLIRVYSYADRFATEARGAQ